MKLYFSCVLVTCTDSVISVTRSCSVLNSVLQSSGKTLGMPLLPFGGRGGHVMCNYIIYCNCFGYHIAQVIRWDPQTWNGGWVGAWPCAAILLVERPFTGFGRCCPSPWLSTFTECHVTLFGWRNGGLGLSWSIYLSLPSSLPFGNFVWPNFIPQQNTPAKTRLLSEDGISPFQTHWEIITVRLLVLPPPLYVCIHLTGWYVCSYWDPQFTTQQFDISVIISLVYSLQVYQWAIKCPTPICSSGGAWIYTTLSRPAASRHWQHRKHAKQKQSLQNFGIKNWDALRCGLNFLREFAQGFSRAEKMLISN